MTNDDMYDVLVIGSGAAGLNLVLHLPDNLRIAVIAKGGIEESSTYNAQGGIAAVLDETDSTDSHIEDTLSAGGNLCREDAVRFIVESAPNAIRELADIGVGFNRVEGLDGNFDTFHLTHEGGHSHRRIVHASDATGKAVETTLASQAFAKPNLKLLEHHLAIDLIREKNADGSHGRCVGAYALNNQDGHVYSLLSRVTVIATGGASKVYLYTSNPDGCTGDGIAMAWRAGCRIANMEFTQFHPTCLYHPEAKNFLITEAVRGEGGHLLLPNGERFMDRFDERGELAPRDIVARAIDHEMKRLGVEHMYLDISHKPADFILEHFPTVHERCLSYGIDMTKDPIPVVPAAHYTCGGVVTDLQGRTGIDGLYAIGEVACTGLHGANRMASNSLLECLVLASSAAQDIQNDQPDLPDPTAIPTWDESWVTNSDEEVVVAHNWEELRRIMWDYVGIVRTTKRLQRARRRIDLLLREIDEYYGNFRVTGDLLELRNLAVVADLIIRSAMLREESRGLHYTLDYPDRDDDDIHDTVLTPDRYTGEDPRWERMK